MAYERHAELEGKWIRFSVYTFLAVAVGGLVLVIPPFFLQGTVEPIEGLAPYSALQQEGRDLYVREACYVCHSQQIRPFKTETDRYGPYSLAGESVYDRPFQFGSRRTGPDLARIGGKYPDSWHWIHFGDPRDIEPRSNMPDFDFLRQTEVDLSLTERKLATLAKLGHPYSEAQITGAVAAAEAEMAEIAKSLRSDGIELSETEARSEAIALIAYLQVLGTSVTELPPVDTAGSGNAGLVEGGAR